METRTPGKTRTQQIEPTPMSGRDTDVGSNVGDGAGCGGGGHAVHGFASTHDETYADGGGGDMHLSNDVSSGETTSDANEWCRQVLGHMGKSWRTGFFRELYLHLAFRVCAQEHLCD